MSSTIGNNLKVTLFGESHGVGIGCVIDNFPAGFTIDTGVIEAFMARRRPGHGVGATSRPEPDMAEIISGVYNGRTSGSPITALIRNVAARSSDYDNLLSVPRPGHADYTEWIKTGGANDPRGGGHSSGRIMAGLCFAGALAKDYLLKERGIDVNAWIKSIGTCEIIKTESNEDGLSDDARALIQKVKGNGDSIGGVIGCVISGFPAGFGAPIFDGVENRLAMGLFGIPAVKGVEFGKGFNAARLTGSQNNDPFYLDEDKNIRTVSNNHGGVLGGISSGMDITFSVAIKPTPSVAIPQRSVDLKRKKDCTLAVSGRHDACIVPRAVPCVEALAAVVALDILLD